MEGTLDIWSIVSGKDGKPYVQFKFDEEHKFQLTPIEARQHAYKILQVSFAAEADAFFVNFIVEKIGLELEKAVGLLADFRHWRAKNEH
jgi:hypothetical protein